MANTSASLTLIRRDHKTYRLEITDENGVVTDITGGSLIFTVKVSPDDVAIIIQKSSSDPNEIEITDPVNGVALIKLVPLDSADVTPTSYKFDVQYTDSAGFVTTVVIGTLNLIADVTD